MFLTGCTEQTSNSEILFNASDIECSGPLHRCINSILSQRLVADLVPRTARNPQSKKSRDAQVLKIRRNKKLKIINTYGNYYKFVNTKTCYTYSNTKAVNFVDWSLLELVFKLY